MIPCKNVYYMMAYAFRVLREQGYQKIATEQFDNNLELLTAILCKGVSVQIKRGLLHDYVEQTEALSLLKGKINISASIKEQTMVHKKLVCEYDDYTTDAYKNRIIKTTFMYLLKGDISTTLKKEIRKLLIYFDGVQVVNRHDISWPIRYGKNDQHYQLIMAVCNMIMTKMLVSTTEGSVKVMTYIDEQSMCKLYEKFIYEYYRQEHKSIRTNADQIAWMLDNDCDTSMLPTMQSDVTLHKDNRVLIIDAKYYTHSTQLQYEKHTYHSHNMYQIFTYVKNKEVEMKQDDAQVSGMLLYAKTDDEVHPDGDFMMGGNKISVKTLDLNCDFVDIKKQLDDIAKVMYA